MPFQRMRPSRAERQTIAVRDSWARRTSVRTVRQSRRAQRRLHWTEIGQGSAGPFSLANSRRYLARATLLERLTALRTQALARLAEAVRPSEGNSVRVSTTAVLPKTGEENQPTWRLPSPRRYLINGPTELRIL